MVPTKEMVADFMIKPQQGSHFRRLRYLIMGTTSIKKAKIPSKSTVTVTKRDGSSMSGRSREGKQLWGL
jgi:hypothetical protein